MPGHLAVNAAKPRYPWVFAIGGFSRGCEWRAGGPAHSLDLTAAHAIHRPSGQVPMNAPASTAAVASSSRNGDGVPMNTVENRAHHDRMANAIRALAMDAVEQAKSGH